MRRYSSSLLIAVVFVVSTLWIFSQSAEKSAGQFRSAADSGSMPNMLKSQDEQIKCLEKQVTRLASKVAILEAKNGIVDNGVRDPEAEEKVLAKLYALTPEHAEQVATNLSRAFALGISTGQVAIQYEKESNSVLVAGRETDHALVKRMIKRLEERAAAEKEKRQELKVEIDEKSPEKK